ncbi:hypothetical protein L6452_14545 [Arctium lappa]|uniref:Uncharacterized protein n=1 Tax=Arctium lappa TaxID=4217 RepID=A0ACB9CLC0_ARCLA|nr:hypothetical protein L6452_14545 [Arctium lappa]
MEGLSVEKKVFLYVIVALEIEEEEDTNGSKQEQLVTTTKKDQNESIVMVLLSTVVVVCGSLELGACVGYTAPTQSAIVFYLNLLVAKSSFVDLDGSERVNESGSAGNQLKNVQSINKSLSVALVGIKVWI